MYLLICVIFRKLIVHISTFLVRVRLWITRVYLLLDTRSLSGFFHSTANWKTEEMVLLTGCSSISQSHSVCLPRRLKKKYESWINHMWRISGEQIEQNGEGSTLSAKKWNGCLWRYQCSLQWILARIEWKKKYSLHFLLDFYQLGFLLFLLVNDLYTRF